MFMVLTSLKRIGTKLDGRLSTHDVMGCEINLLCVLKCLHTAMPGNRFYLDCNVSVM